MDVLGLESKVLFLVLRKTVIEETEVWRSKRWKRRVPVIS